MFPSEYEGFGAPVVEAMALGTPVICSDQPALAEVVGDAGLVLARDSDAWAGALDVVAAQPPTMIAAGRERARAFTAAASGAAIAAAYQLAVERRIGPTRRPAHDPAARPANRRAVSALRSRHRTDRRGDEPDRRRAGVARPRGARGDRPALVPGPCDRAGVARPMDPTRDDDMGLDQPGASVPRRRQDEPVAACRSDSPATRCSPASRRCASGGRCRRVDAVIAMSPPITLGLTGWLVSRLRRGVDDLQHPGRVPRRGDRDRGDHEPLDHRAARSARSGELPARPTPSRCCPTIWRTTCGPRCAPPTAAKVHVIPNFVDTEAITPADRLTPYRRGTRAGRRPGRAVRAAMSGSRSRSISCSLPRRHCPTSRS